MSELDKIKRRADRRKLLMSEKLYGEWDVKQLNELREINQLMAEDIQWLLAWINKN